MVFENGIFSYRKILIDSDFEPDDKAALELLFRKLSQYSHAHPSYHYPDITIIAGSSTTPALKVAQAKAIVDRLKKQGIIPKKHSINIVEGSATTIEHKNDGAELLSQEIREEALQKTPSVPSMLAIETIIQFLKNANHDKCVYLALREVIDLKLAAENLHDFKSVDFMGTLSLNVRKPYLNAENPVTNGCNAFVEHVLKKFKIALCFDTYNSACGQNSTAIVWGEEFKKYLKSNAGTHLKMASDNWDNHNIIACIESIEQATEAIGISHIQMQEKVIPLFKKVLNDFKHGKLAISAAAFTDAVYANLGEEVVKNLQTPSSQAAKEFNPNFNPFLSMMFNAPQICIADLGFIGIICETDILRFCIEHVTLTYDGPFSKVEKIQNPAMTTSNIYYVKTDWEQLQYLGQKVVQGLLSSKKEAPFPGFLRYSMSEKKASTPKVEKVLSNLVQDNQTSKATVLALQYNAWCQKHSPGKQRIKDDFWKTLPTPKL